MLLFSQSQIRQSELSKTHMNAKPNYSSTTTALTVTIIVTHFTKNSR